MKESISYTYLLNMMLVFIFVSFSVLLCVFSYTKAFRVNSKIASALEKAEGYNELSQEEISYLVRSFGYQQFDINCGDKNGADAIPGTTGYCLYEFEEEINGTKYVYYGITTYMAFDIPVITNLLKLPVYNTTEKIYIIDNFETGSGI